MQTVLPLDLGLVVAALNALSGLSKHLADYGLPVIEAAADGGLSAARGGTT